MLEILLADDESSIRLVVRDALRAAGHTVTVAVDGQEAIARLSESRFDLVVSDIRMPGADGIAVLRHVRTHTPDTEVMLMTANADVEEAVGALKEGAADYLTKPFEMDELLVRVARIDERHTLRRQLSVAREQLARRAAGDDMVGRGPTMVRLFDRIATLAGSDASVMITGESGTGKELVACRLHELSPRRDRPFVVVNCAAFPETLLEAELFGHERGAFTGAVKKRDGRFRAAHGGTLFLDEVAEIPLLAQAKLLRVLQTGTFEPLGTNAPVTVDVRVISATHRNLKQCIAEGRFREDLYYRLNVLGVHLPPLRERRDDLPLLIQHFLGVFTPRGRATPSISPRAWAALSQHLYPGNVRELQHAIQHAVVMAGAGEIQLDDLPTDVAGSSPSESPASTIEGEAMQSLAAAARAFEREYLLRALRVVHGKRAQAAELLGISRKNLWEKLKAHDLSDSDVDD